ncbi:MAG: hypothetical protein ACI87W_003081 [Halieaceae bacterium]
MREAAYEQVEHDIRQLVSGSLAVIVEAPKPTLPAPPFRCSDRFNRSNPVCREGLSIDRVAMQRLRQPKLNAMHTMAAETGGITIWDSFDVLCPSTPCAASVDGRPLFFDGDHVSGYTNDLLAPSLGRILAMLWSSAPDTTPGRLPLTGV